MKDQTIFFSYSRKDSEKFALKLATDLSEAGVKVWMDQLSLEVGPAWDRQIGKALKRCQRFLIILSPESMESENVMDEVSYAKDENKQIIPILYKKCHVDFRLRRLQHVDYTTDYDHGFTKLLATLNVKVHTQQIEEETLQRIDNFDDVESKDKEVFNAKVYISYAWGGESEEMADLLEKVLGENQIHLIRDNNDLEYKANITELKKNIGRVDGVIVVINNKYLKSTYCMFELMEIYDNKYFPDRVFPIVLGDANIFQGEGILAYKEYWKAKMDDLDAKMVGAEATKTLQPEYEQCVRIYRYMDKVVGILKNLNSLVPDIHRSSNFEAIINTIKERLNQAP